MLVYYHIINRENKSLKPAKDTQCLKRKIYNCMECSLPFTEALTVEQQYVEHLSIAELGHWLNNRETSLAYLSQPVLSLEVYSGCFWLKMGVDLQTQTSIHTHTPDLQPHLHGNKSTFTCKLTTTGLSEEPGTPLQFSCSSR